MTVLYKRNQLFRCINLIQSGTELTGDMSPSTFGQGGTLSFVPPQYFVIKNNVVVQVAQIS